MLLRFVAILLACSPALLPAEPLNVVFILADDLGYMDISPNNPETFYETPHLQQLAASGMRFTNGYAACPVCSPTRSSIMTGQYPARTANTDFFGGPNGHARIPDDYDPAKHGKFGHHAKRPVRPAPYLNHLARGHTTLAEALKNHGYATHFAGKWHLGGKGSLPTDHGFDANKGGTHRGGPYTGKKYFSPYNNPYLSNGPDGEHLPDRLAAETAEFIASHKDQPFLAYLSFYSVHTPLMGRPDLVKKYEAKRKKLGLRNKTGFDHPRKVRLVQEHPVYAAMVEALDLAVGKVLRALDENGVADRTLVIFFSDNGGLSTSEGSPTSNLPLRAGKGWLYEGGIREPLLIRWPGHTKPGSTCDAPVLSTDFFPTILEAASLPLLPGQHRDGASLAPLLDNPKGPFAPGRALFWHYPHWGNQGGIPGAALRDGKWKLVSWDWKKDCELYNLADDPGEKNNLAERFPERAAAMRKKIEALRKETGAFPTFPDPDLKKDSFQSW